MCDAIFLFLQTSLLFSHTSRTDVCYIALHGCFFYGALRCFLPITGNNKNVIPPAIFYCLLAVGGPQFFRRIHGKCGFFTAVRFVYTPLTDACTGRGLPPLCSASRMLSPSATLGCERVYCGRLFPRVGVSFAFFSTLRHCKSTLARHGWLVLRPRPYRLRDQQVVYFTD